MKNERKVDGLVYFLQMDGGDRCVKVGYTIQPPRARARCLETASPYKLRVIGAYVGDRDEERKVKGMFYHHRVRGEWYWPAPELLEYVNTYGGKIFNEEYHRGIFREDVIARLKLAFPRIEDRVEFLRRCGKRHKIDEDMLIKWSHGQRVANGRAVAVVERCLDNLSNETAEMQEREQLNALYETLKHAPVKRKAVDKMMEGK